MTYSEARERGFGAIAKSSEILDVVSVVNNRDFDTSARLTILDLRTRSYSSMDFLHNC